MLKVQVNMVSVISYPSSRPDLHRHRATHDVTRGEIFSVWGIPLHKTLPIGIGQKTALTARALCDEATRSINPCRVKLNKLHVLQWQARPQDHGIPVSGTRMGGGGRKVGPAVAPCGKNHPLCPEDMDGPGFQTPRDDASALPRLHDEVETEIFDEKLYPVTQ